MTCSFGSEASQKYKDAADYFLKAQRKFPNSENAPIYLHNRARILDNILNEKNNARLAFDELIELYPNHALSIIFPLISPSNKFIAGSFVISATFVDRGFSYISLALPC